MLKREQYLEKIRNFYNSNLIKILVGIRRSGKSVILSQIIQELKDKGIDSEHIIYVNFEFIEFEDLTDYKELNKYIKERIKDDKIYYLFFDEIQNVENFEKVINSLRASKKVSIFIKCKLCGKTFNNNNYQLFGTSCFKTICELLGVVIPKNIKEKDKEKYICSLVSKKLNKKGLTIKQKQYLTELYIAILYIDKIEYVNLNKLKRKIQKQIDNIFFGKQ